MLGAHGDLFFHYTKAETAFGAIIPDKTVRLSPYSKMSDPLESKEWMIGAAGFVPEGGVASRFVPVVVDVAPATSIAAGV